MSTRKIDHDWINASTALGIDSLAEITETATRIYTMNADTYAEWITEDDLRTLVRAHMILGICGLVANENKDRASERNMRYAASHIRDVVVALAATKGLIEMEVTQL
jgi:hypothetical protein